jgi:NAD-dependent SIR2 family protein deacetylase
MNDVDSRSELLDLAGTCQVLLIAGTSVSTPHIYQLFLELADRIHASDGVVVFINTKDMSKGRIGHSVDFYLQLDLQLCARFMMHTIHQQV